MFKISETLSVIFNDFPSCEIEKGLEGIYQNKKKKKKIYTLFFHYEIRHFSLCGQFKIYYRMKKKYFNDINLVLDFIIHIIPFLK